MIETLISSKTRIKLLLKFFLNSNTTSYLRSLESEFGESTNAIRVELNRLENAGMLSPLVMKDLRQGEGQALALFRHQSPVPIDGANLCASLTEQACFGETEMMRIIERLLEIGC